MAKTGDENLIRTLDQSCLAPFQHRGLKSATLLILGLFFNVNSWAGIVASLDRTEVPQDESITLKIAANQGEALDPKFDAPDFEIMNQFENSQFHAVYINGKFENKSERSISFILRPVRTGLLKIQNIRNGSDRAPDLSVQVIQERPYQQGVGGEKPQLNSDQRNFFMRGEVSKSRLYRGEQLIVSYYLYRRTRVTVRDVMQYPSFDGFLREDLEMPVMSQRPDYEAVSLGGIPFERTLIARYALYPLREGKLKIDGINIRADYIPRNQTNDDLMEDPFFQFFTQVTPRTGTSKSDPITVEVLPIPQEGKSKQYTGGVGVFEVVSQLNPAPIKAYSPITLQVQVRGKGNTSMIEFPSVTWPSNLKFFESQGKSKSLGQGMSEKTFEVVLVPQGPGKLEIPSIEFEFFNPESRSFIRKQTAPIGIDVGEGDPGSSPSISGSNLSQLIQNETAPPQTSPKESFGELRNKNDFSASSASGMLGQPWWRWVSWAGLLILVGFGALVIWDETKKRSLARLEIIKRRQGMESWWTDLKKESEDLVHKQAHASQFAPIMEKLVDQLYSSLDSAFQISSRAMPQRDLAKILTEQHAVTSEQWRQIRQILDFSEAVRFASQAGVVSDRDAQQQTPEMISNAQKLCAEISSKRG
jgi:hypothetical protein